MQPMDLLEAFAVIDSAGSTPAQRAQAFRLFYQTLSSFCGEAQVDRDAVAAVLDRWWRRGDANGARGCTTLASARRYLERSFKNARVDLWRREARDRDLAAACAREGAEPWPAARVDDVLVEAAEAGGDARPAPDMAALEIWLEDSVLPAAGGKSGSFADGVRQRLAIALERTTQQQLGAQLGKSNGTLQRAQHRALEKLRSYGTRLGRTQPAEGERILRLVDFLRSNRSKVADP